MDTPHCCKCEVAHQELDRADLAIRAAEALLTFEPDTSRWTADDRGSLEVAQKNSMRLLAKTVETNLMPRMP